MSAEEHRLIGLHNHSVQFAIGNNVYIIPRLDIENKFKLYWFMGNLYEEIIKNVTANKSWLNRYKV